jgi:hypothetical protein
LNLRLFAALEGTGVECQAITDLMGVYIQFLVAIGFLDAPPRKGEDGVEDLPELTIATADATLIVRSTAGK